MIVEVADVLWFHECAMTMGIFYLIASYQHVSALSGTFFPVLLCAGQSSWN